MNNETFFIEETLLEDVQKICNYIEDENLRERAVANALGPKIVSGLFENNSVDINSGLHNIPQILKNTEISDIYLNESYIDVRLYFNDNDLCVPKSHFDNDLLPVAYMFVKLENNCEGGVVTGFITPESIDKSDVFDNYYPIDEKDLVSFYEIEPLLVNKDFTESPDDLQKDIYKFLDNELEDKNSFYRLLLHSSEARTLLLNIASVENILCSAAIELKPSVVEEVQLDIDEKQELSFDETGDNSFIDINEQTESLSFEGDLELVNDAAFEPILTDSEEHSIELINTEAGTDAMEEINAIEGSIEETFEFNTEIADETAIEDLSISNDEEFIETSSAEIDFVQEEQENSASSDFNYAEPDNEIVTGVDIKEEESVKDVFDAEITENEENILTDSDSLNLTEETEIVDTDEEDILSRKDFSTTTTPSLSTYDENDKLLEELLEADDEVEYAKNNQFNENNLTQNQNQNHSSNNQDVDKQIDALFNQEIYNGNPNNSGASEFEGSQPKKKSILLPFMSILLILAAGWFGYNRFYNSSSALPNEIKDVKNSNIPVQKPEKAVEEAMPNETVENVKLISNNNEGVNTGIPAIEQNLDASIAISNLAISWEVPANYATNSTAKRYFTKLGKIIRLNLKTELLLLTKMPITNKITVELEYNPKTNKFVATKIKQSSGEQSIDRTILNTINQALSINLNMNLSSFGNSQSNPVLIINL